MALVLLIATSLACGGTEKPRTEPTPTSPSTSVLLPTKTPVLSAVPTSDPRIVFASKRDGNYDIYVMRDDGTGVTNLTNHPADDLGPRWSPDGSRIVFHSNRDGNDEIYVMQADGSGVTNLTNSPAEEREAEWSPDGTQIVFYSTNAGNGIYVMNADGSDRVLLYQLGVTQNVAHPAWSPDGSRIAFTWGYGTSFEICTINSAGSDREMCLTDNQIQDLHPSWSPDNSRLVYGSWRDGNRDLYVMNADGSRETRLTDDKASEKDPSWSPDGSRIAFVTDHDGNDEIYIMNADGSGVQRLTDNPAYDALPDYWSPVPSETP